MCPKTHMRRKRIAAMHYYVPAVFLLSLPVLASTWHSSKISRNEHNFRRYRFCPVIRATQYSLLKTCCTRLHDAIERPNRSRVDFRPLKLICQAHPQTLVPRTWFGFPTALSACDRTSSLNRRTVIHFIPRGSLLRYRHAMILWG